MKTYLFSFFLTFAFLLSSCTPMSSISTSPAEETEAITIPTPSKDTEISPEKEYSLLSTTMGDFIIVSARLVDEARDTKAPPGEKFLLVELARPGMKKINLEFSIESFRDLIVDNHDEIYVLGNNDSHIYSNGMCGWLNEDEFVMGFPVFQPLPETYTLFWMDNPPILLDIEE